MTLHEAIEQVLNDKQNGLSFDEIQKIINEKRLYQKKDKLLIEESQIRIRISNHAQLFRVENGKVFVNSTFNQNKFAFDQIVFDVINSTTDHHISTKYLVIPLVFSLKRFFESDENSYHLKIS